MNIHDENKFQQCIYRNDSIANIGQLSMESGMDDTHIISCSKSTKAYLSCTGAALSNDTIQSGARA